MARTPFVDDNGMRKGAWSREEDEKLRAYIRRFGHWNWRLLPKFAGLARNGKSCRLRWMNYLKPGVKRGNFTQQEHDQILKLHAKLGNKWSAMAQELPRRTDNEIKNYWYGHIAKRIGKRAIHKEEDLIDVKNAIKVNSTMKSDMFEELLLESGEVPNTQANSSTNQDEQAELQVVNSSPDNSTSAEPITPDDFCCTLPFEIDTDATYIGEEPGFWAEMPPLEMDIYSQASHFSSFLEEDLMFFNVCYNDFTSSSCTALMCALER